MLTATVTLALGNGQEIRVTPIGVIGRYQVEWMDTKKGTFKTAFVERMVLSSFLSSLDSLIAK